MSEINNSALDLIMTRRSVRKYTDQPVSDEQLELLLSAACNAPSSKSTHPTHFIVIKDKDKKLELSVMHGGSKALEQAPLAIIVCGDTSLSWACWRDDCAAATMNIIFAAEALGLSSCWCGIYPRDKRVDGFSKYLEIPGHIMPYSMIILGYADAPKNRRDGVVEKRIHRDERW